MHSGEMVNSLNGLSPAPLGENHVGCLFPTPTNMKFLIADIPTGLVNAIADFGDMIQDVQAYVLICITFSVLLGLLYKLDRRSRH